VILPSVARPVDHRLTPWRGQASRGALSAARWSQILTIINQLGVKGAVGYAYEYAGSAIERSQP
jgi:hypothetical protein